MVSIILLAAVMCLSTVCRFRFILGASSNHRSRRGGRWDVGHYSRGKGWGCWRNTSSQTDATSTWDNVWWLTSRKVVDVWPRFEWLTGGGAVWQFAGGPMRNRTCAAGFCVSIMKKWFLLLKNSCLSTLFYQHGLIVSRLCKFNNSALLCRPGNRTDLESGSESPGGQEAPPELQARPSQCSPAAGGFWSWVHRGEREQVSRTYVGVLIAFSSEKEMVNNNYYYLWDCLLIFLFSIKSNLY